MLTISLIKKSLVLKFSITGYFNAAYVDDGSVLAMTLMQEDRYLITGDTAGHVCVWDIREYCSTDQSEVIFYASAKRGVLF